MSKIVNKGGKVPTSVKEASEASDFLHDDLDFNILKLDPELKAELDGQGLVPRWINAKNYMHGGNFHQSGWRAYRKQQSQERGALDFNYGVSPEGYIIRNDLLLAVKPKEAHAKWKARIAHRTRINSNGGVNRADELREAARMSGVKAKVHEGYDENGDD